MVFQRELLQFFLVLNGKSGSIIRIVFHKWRTKTLNKSRFPNKKWEHIIKPPGFQKPNWIYQRVNVERHRSSKPPVRPGAAGRSMRSSHCSSLRLMPLSCATSVGKTWERLTNIFTYIFHVDPYIYIYTYNLSMYLIYVHLYMTIKINHILSCTYIDIIHSLNIY